MTEFNAITIITSILEKFGYRRRPPKDQNPLGYKEYQINPTHIRFRLPYGSRGHKRFGILRIKGNVIHVHGSEVDCTFINLADPGSLDLLRNTIASAEKPNGNPGKS